MIRVYPAPEPFDFDERVRQPGQQLLDELTGHTVTRPGPKRADAGRYATVHDIPTARLTDYWTRCLDDLHEQYAGVCAYSALHINEVIGARTVDHWLPKSRHQHLAYEWSNYRLASALMNTRKGDREDLLDPFTVGDDWFSLSCVTGELTPNPTLDPDTQAQVQRTIDALDLNDRRCCDARTRYVTDYLNGEVTLRFVMRNAPHVASELIRQRWLREEDQPYGIAEEE